MDSHRQVLQAGDVDVLFCLLCNLYLGLENRKDMVSAVLAKDAQLQGESTFTSIMGHASAIPCGSGCGEGCKASRTLVENQSRNLMPHLLIAGPLLPCADFPKHGNPHGINMDVEPVWCWGGWAALCSPKPEATLCSSYQEAAFPILVDLAFLPTALTRFLIHLFACPWGSM